MVWKTPEAEVVEELARLLHLDVQSLARVLPQPVAKEPAPVSATDRGENSLVDDLDTVQTWFSGGSPILVLLGVAENGVITVAVPAVDWHGHVPMVRVDTAEVFERTEVAVLAHALEEAVARSVETRRSRFRVCDECHEVNPPEWMEGSICQRCAQQNHRVVY